jgi:integrase
VNGYRQELPFFYKASRNPAYLANEVYERMTSLGTRCRVTDCRPHRLRDTFAVRKLLAGFQLEDVSRLLGHSSVKVTEAYYAKWISSRKVRLERLGGSVAREHVRNPLWNRQRCVLSSARDAFTGLHQLPNWIA